MFILIAITPQGELARLSISFGFNLERTFQRSWKPVYKNIPEPKKEFHSKIQGGECVSSPEHANPNPVYNCP